MRTGLQWAYPEQRADGRRALNTSAVRHGIPFSSSRGFGTFLSISWSAGSKLWPLRSHCLFPLRLTKAPQHSLSQKLPCTPCGSAMGEGPVLCRGGRDIAKKPKEKVLGMSGPSMRCSYHTCTHTHTTQMPFTYKKGLKKGGRTIYPHRPGQSQSYSVTLSWVRREFSFHWLN